MSLFSTSFLGLPIKGWRLFDVESTMKRKADSDINVEMLHWELEKQMKIYEEIKRRKVENQLRDDAITNYKWLRRNALMRPELEMSNSAKREFQELCERTRPSDLNQITETVVRLLQSKEPAPEDVPGIFINVLRSFVVPDDDEKRKSSIVHRLISGSLRRLKRTNKIDPSNDTETKVTQSPIGDVEGSTPCRDHLIFAGKSRLHCLINLEDEAHPMTNFAMPFSKRERNYADSISTCKASNTKTHQSDREAWTSCIEEVTKNPENLDYQTSPNNVLAEAGYSCVASDMEVVDLASASSSEEGLVDKHGTLSTSLPV